MRTWIDQQLDHRMILHANDPAPSMLQECEPVFVINENPTAENIAKLIFDHVRREGFPVVEVVLWQTQNSSALF